MLAFEDAKIKTLARRRLVPSTEADAWDANCHLPLAQAQRS
jgi:hypothetical protein